jgi:GNAT superfamily N-acetyltransferase
VDGEHRTSEGMPATRQRIDEVLEWTVRSLADEIRDVRGGWVARSGSLPLVHSLNRLQVAGGMDPARVLRMADDHLADLPYRHVEVGDGATAAALEQELVTGGAGWKVDREVYMVLDDDGPASGGSGAGSSRPDDPLTPSVRLTGEESDALMRRWLVEEQLDRVPGALDQLSVYNRREGRLWGETVLGVREAGTPVALTKSRSHGDVGWVEDVYTVPEARQKGYARLLVGQAVRMAREAAHDMTFIIADDNDWPKHLYSSLGFRPVGLEWTFHLDLPE